MSALDTIIARARSARANIVLPEAGDQRVVEAARRITDDDIAEVTLVGETGEIESNARRTGIDLAGIRVLDPGDNPDGDRHAATLLEARRHKGMNEEQAASQILDPLVLAAVMVRAGDAGGCVAGAVHTTGAVVRAALQVVGMKDRNGLVSSFFIMDHTLPHQALQGTAIFADCALVIDPDAPQLARIAADSADSATALTGIDPRIALLSFSTAGSARHANVDKVREAGELLHASRPDLAVMAEVQFDAAIVPEILARKAPEIEVPAPANVFIFPDLQSANIGYKIAQRIGGAIAIGPVLQGLNRPVNDLSRGCSTDDIVQLVAVTAVQAQTK